MTGDATADSLAAWEAVAPGWERRRSFVWDASRVVGESLVDALDPRPGETILELAAGPGDTGMAAAARVGATGRVLSTDFSPLMVAAARRRSAELGLGNVEHRVADAQQLELPDASVDGVLCRWGYMLMPEPARALGETFRVLRPGGRLAFSVWADAHANPWGSAVGRALVELGHLERPDPDAPGPFRLGDAERVRRLIAEAGFETPAVHDVPVLWSYRGLDEYWEISDDLSFMFATVVRSLPADALDRLREMVELAFEPYRDGSGGYAVPGLSRNVVTRKTPASATA